VHAASLSVIDSSARPRRVDANDAAADLNSETLGEPNSVRPFSEADELVELLTLRRVQADLGEARL
jgi:hypothetical protein